MEVNREDIFGLLQSGEKYLEERGVLNARNNVEWMLCRLLNCTRGDLYTARVQEIDDETRCKFDEFLRRRGEREPLQYILGSTEFMSLPFIIPSGVFIPRFETEILVETVEHIISHTMSVDRVEILDLCSGAGVIAVSLARRLPGVFATGVDASNLAVSTAVDNARLNGVEEKVRFLAGDARDFLASGDAEFDAVVCNPPYIPTDKIPLLPLEVREYEPTQSLDGGKDGLEFYRSLVPVVPGRLKQGGFLFMEIGSDQAADVKEICRRSSMVDIEVIKDYNHLDRVIVARAH